MEHHADTPAGLNGQFQPEFNGNDFVGTDNIAEVAKFLPLGPFSNGALIEKGEEICSLSIRSLSKDYPRKSLHDLDRACFDAAYISAIMSGYNTEHPYQGLGLEDEAKIVHGIEFINDKPINWTLGSALYFLLENDENE